MTETDEIITKPTMSVVLRSNEKDLLDLLVWQPEP